MTGPEQHALLAAAHSAGDLLAAVLVRQACIDGCEAIEIVAPGRTLVIHSERTHRGELHREALRIYAFLQVLGQAAPDALVDAVSDDAAASPESP